MSTIVQCSCFLFLLTISGLAGQEPPGGFYTTRYDHIDVENILNQKRLVYYYTECLLDRGPCTPQGIEFKRILPEAIRTNCLRCTEKQRFVTMKSIRRLMKEYPDIWSQLSAVWDPTGEYIKILEESVSKKTNRSPVVGAESVINVQRLADPVSKIASTANTIANKPVRFSTTIRIPQTSTTTTAQPTTRKQITTEKQINTQSTTTTNTPGRKVVQESKRVNYNYDFAVTVKPPAIHQNKPMDGLNIVLKGVNNIIAPITDIAGKVITAGTDLAGIVLNALGVKKT